MNEIMVQSICFLLGAILWTFAEYIIHRDLGHKNNKKNPFSIEHLRHHRDLNYFAKPYKKLLAAILVMSLMVPLVALGTGWKLSIYFSLGFTLMYILYEILHSRVHTHAPHTIYGRWMRKHHFHHHFKNPKVNHGLTTPLWDIIFGTLETPVKVRVPQKLLLPWMIDHHSGELLTQFYDDYECTIRSSKILLKS